MTGQPGLGWWWLVLGAVCILVLAAVLVPMWREDPNRRARRAARKGLRG